VRGARKRPRCATPNDALSSGCGDGRAVAAIYECANQARYMKKKKKKGFIPPGAKHLKGNKLSTSQVYMHSSKTNPNDNRIPSTFPIHALHFHCAYYLAFRSLVISGRRVILKLCFQVFIVLSPADEAWPALRTRVLGGVAVLMVYKVIFPGPCIRLISSSAAARRRRVQIAWSLE